MTSRIGKKSWVFIPLAGAIVLILWSMIQRMLDVAAVQDALERNWEIGFRPATEESRPPLLPAFLDDALESYLDKKYEGVQGYNENLDRPHGRNLATVYHERFRAMFRLTTRDIHIFSPFAFRGDLGTALQRFPRLRRIIVSDAYYVKEAEWKLLCGRLRGLPELEELELVGSNLTSDAVAPLAGHPRLRSIVIYAGNLTPDCIKTFTTLPHLTQIEFSQSNSEVFTPELKTKIEASLPGVKINWN